MKGVQTYNHERLKLLAVINGDLRTEAELHERFCDDRVRGEWFRLSADLKKFIAAALPRPPASLTKNERAIPSFDPAALQRLILFLRLNERDVMYLEMFTPILRDYLLNLAKVYGLAKGMTLTAVSKRFYGQSSFLTKFGADKCSISIDRYEAMIEKFRAEWPQGLYFPKLPKIYVAPPRRRSTVSRKAA